MTHDICVYTGIQRIWRQANVMTDGEIVEIRPNSITLSSSIAGRRPARESASELDSVMEFGKFLYAVLLARQLVCELVCDLLRLKFHYAIQVADLVSDLAQTGSSYLDMSR